MHKNLNRRRINYDVSNGRIRSLKTRHNDESKLVGNNKLAPMENTSRKVRVVGNSEVVTLPSNVKEKLAVQNGDDIEFLEQDGQIVIRKSKLSCKQNVRKHK